MKQKKPSERNQAGFQAVEGNSHQNYISDIREELRVAFEQLEQCKLSNELEGQKRWIINEQNEKLKEENN
jgi:hypothetical protein